MTPAVEWLRPNLWAWLSLSLAVAVADADDLAHLRYLGAAMEHHAARPTNFSARVEQRTHNPLLDLEALARRGESVSGAIEKDGDRVMVTNTARYFRQGELLRIIHDEAPPPVPKNLYVQRREVLSDGRTAYGLTVYRERNPGETEFRWRYDGSIHPANALLPNGIWHAGGSWTDPRLEGYCAVYLKPMVPLFRLLLQQTAELRYAGVETDPKLGIPLEHVVYRRPSVTHHWWLDPAHGMMIRRAQMVSGEGANAVIDCESVVEEVREIGGGYLPRLTRITANVYRTVASPPAPLPYAVGGVMVETVTVEDLVSGGPPMPEFFTPWWPQETRIEDSIKHEQRKVEYLSPAEWQAVSKLRRAEAAAAGVTP
ncbi:MAG: hypothetical protein HUU35_07950 [Armatimonadetes bacterium]|nr:hypothetical protein [Armatimonadota bacterium]